MNRYQPAATMNIPEHPEGVFCLYADVLELVEPLVQFAMDHAEEIENDEEGFGALAPILAMVRGAQH